MKTRLYAAPCESLPVKRTLGNVPFTFQGIRRAYDYWPTSCVLKPTLLDVAGVSRGYFFKLERQSGSLFFATDDSVDIFEIHCDDHYPEKHETPSVRKD